MKELKVEIAAWQNGDPIPEEYAFCVPDEIQHATMGEMCDVSPYGTN
jgi:hypothetical protein